MEFEEKEKTYDDFRGAGVYADLLLDRTFKKAFDPDSPNKICLIELLNAVLEGEIDRPITEVQSRDKEFCEGSNDNRATIFDLYCIDSVGRRFIVEVQLARQENIVNRAIYYAAQAVVAQGEKGRGYLYGLDPVITVVLMDFKAFGDDRYIRRAKLRERDCSDLIGTLTFAFVELPKFKKTLEELRTPLDWGLYALKNIKSLRKMPESYTGTPFELLFSVAELAKLTKEEQKMIDEAQKAKWDAAAIRDYAIKSGRKEGLEQGIKEGIEKGIAKGIERGIEKGIEKGMKKGVAKGVKMGILEGESRKAREMAKSLLEQGVPIEVIAKASKLSADEIQKLE